MLTDYLPMDLVKLVQKLQFLYLWVSQLIAVHESYRRFWDNALVLESNDIANYRSLNLWDPQIKDECTPIYNFSSIWRTGETPARYAWSSPQFPKNKHFSYIRQQ